MYRIHLILFLVALCQLSQAQTFNRLYQFAPLQGQASAAFGTSATYNGVYIWGNHASSLVGTLHTYVAKLDTAGEVVWKTTLGDSGQISSIASNTGVLQLSNGQLLCLPWLFLRHPVGASYGHTIMTWLDSNGVVLRTKRVTDSLQSKTLDQCLELANGELLCTGMLSSLATTGTNFTYRAHWLVKYDSLGNVIWEKEYHHNYFGISQGDWPYMRRIANRGDSIFVIGGAKIDSPLIGVYAALSGFDASGNHLWDRFLHGRNETDALLMWSEAKPYNDSLWYFSATHSDSLTASGFPTQFKLVHGYINDHGDTSNVRDLHSYHPHPNGVQGLSDQVFVLPDGSKLLAFSLGLNNRFKRFLALQKFNTADELIWERWLCRDTSTSYSLNLYYRGISFAPDGSIYAASGMQVFRNATLDSTGDYAWVARTDSFGCLVPGCHLGDSIFAPSTSLPVILYQQPLKVNLYPNPASDYLQIEVVTEQLPPGLQAAVFNLEGRMLSEQSLEAGKARLPVLNLAPGIYLCRIRSSEGVITYRKFVKN